MPHEASFALFTIALAIEPGLWIGSAGMGVVAPFLTPEILLGIATRPGADFIVVTAVFVLGAKVFYGCPGFNQRAVHRKRVPAQKAADLLVFDNTRGRSQLVSHYCWSLFFPSARQSERDVVVLHKRMITPLREKRDPALRVRSENIPYCVIRRSFGTTLLMPCLGHF